MSGSSDDAQVFMEARAAAPRPATLVTIGNFDGVHRGHVALLREVVSTARSRRLQPVVLTFEPHPNAVLGRAVPALLTAQERKVELILRHDPSLRAVVQPFTRELAQWAPETFANQLLVEALAAHSVIVGEGFRFGSERSGDLASLQILGKRLGFTASSATLVAQGDAVISSTRIRKALESGDVALAGHLLGRPHSVEGQVVAGQQFARTLGVPSANLGKVREQLPRRGVYSVLVDLGDSSPGGPFVQLGTGVANVGVRPTGGAGELRLEVHVHDYTGDLYGRRLRVHFADRIRDECHFESRSALVEQLRKDVARSRADLFAHPADPGAGGAWY